MRPTEQDPIESPVASDGEDVVKVHRRPLGALGEEVSAFGLGTGPVARLLDHGDWDATIGAALDANVTWIDAAPRMWRLHSEEMLGHFTPSYRDRLFLSTRCTPLDGKPFDTSEGAIRAQLEDSLRRLRTDRIDLYQVHDVEATNTKKLLGETLPALVAARERGEVRYIGASGGSLELLREILILFPVDAVLSYARFDLANSDLASELLPAAQERGVAVINASPLHMGLLSSPHHAADVAAHDQPSGEAALEAFKIAGRAGSDLPRLALEYAAHEPRIACTLVGCENAREVRSNVAAFESFPTELEADAITKIREAFKGATLRDPSQQ